MPRHFVNSERFGKIEASNRSSLLPDPGLEIPDHVADGVKSCGVRVRDLAAEFVFKCHDQLIDVERIKIPKKRRVVRDLVFGNALMIRNDSPNPLGNGELI